jgi:hypothetical protein
MRTMVGGGGWMMSDETVITSEYVMPKSYL